MNGRNPPDRTVHGRGLLRPLHVDSGRPRTLVWASIFSHLGFPSETHRQRSAIAGMRELFGQLIRHRLVPAQNPPKVRPGYAQQLREFVSTANTNLIAKPSQLFKRLFHRCGEGIASWRRASAARNSFIKDASPIREPSRKPASV